MTAGGLVKLDMLSGGLFVKLRATGFCLRTRNSSMSQSLFSVIFSVFACDETVNMVESRVSVHHFFTLWAGGRIRQLIYMAH